MHPWPGGHHPHTSYFSQCDLYKIPAKKGKKICIKKEDNLANCYDPNLTSVSPSASAPPASLWSDQKHKPLLQTHLDTFPLQSFSPLNQTSTTNVLSANSCEKQSPWNPRADKLFFNSPLPLIFLLGFFGLCWLNTFGCGNEGGFFMTGHTDLHKTPCLLTGDSAAMLCLGHRRNISFITKQW